MECYSLRENAKCRMQNAKLKGAAHGIIYKEKIFMNKQQTLQNLSNVTKTYLRISQIKTVLTVFLIGYTLTKIIKTIKTQ